MIISWIPPFATALWKHSPSSMPCASHLQVLEHGLFVKHCKVEVYLLELKLCENGNPTKVLSCHFSKADTIGEWLGWASRNPVRTSIVVGEQGVATPSSGLLPRSNRAVVTILTGSLPPRGFLWSTWPTGHGSCPPDMG